MTTAPQPGRLDHLTFKGNPRETRYGWLRLTPAYSVHLVADLVDEVASTDALVLDPFCGTGTTALVCAERGIACDTTDINPFLLWLTQAKTRRYDLADLNGFTSAAARVADAIRTDTDGRPWLPPIHHIEKWWDHDALIALGRSMAAIEALAMSSISPPTADLLKVAFCRIMIGRANVSFGHQSMSFKKNVTATPSRFSTVEKLVVDWRAAVASIAAAACTPIAASPRAEHCDARQLTAKLDADRYTCVVTSPPYPNRMSYIRELRPYLYWLGYLRDGREAGELDWQAIGGTWGCATSNVGKWTPDGTRTVPFGGFDDILGAIAGHSRLLSRYVHKYFDDMVLHVAELMRVVKPGGTVHYIVGNSKFYDVVLPVEDIFAALFRSVGFVGVEVRVVRKRTSKKELFEYIVSARKPAR